VSEPVFTINFRREAFERQQARSRQRITALAGWLGYFGVLALLVWGYSLNWSALDRRTRQIERQTEQFATSQNLPRKVPLDATQIAAIERFHSSPRRWRDKLARLATLIPGNVALTSIAVNPADSKQSVDVNKLVIAGTLLAGAGDDPMRGVVQLVASLQADSAFAAGYQSIKLAQGHAAGQSSASTEFVIECR
jgi:Tfp pilus assembly protein PilN